MKKIYKLVNILIVFLFIINIFIINVNAVELKPSFKVWSNAVYLVNLDTEEHTVVYKKNSNKKIPPASLTKIMTAVVALDSGMDLKKRVTVKTKHWQELWDLGFGVSNVDFRVGEKVRLIDVLYATVLSSACEGSNILGDYIGGGSIKNFIKMMNDKCKELGLENTQFKNTHGIDAKGQYTTAYDMYKLTAYALKNKEFKKIATSGTYDLRKTNIHPKRTIFHTNEMMRFTGYYDERVEGIKTGTTDGSGYSLVTIASNDKYNYLCITLKAPIYNKNNVKYDTRYSYVDHTNLYTWVFDNFRIKTVLKKEETLKEVKVNLGQDKDYVMLSPENKVFSLLPGDIPASSVQKEYDIPESVEAPIKKGQVIGKVTLKLANQEIETVNLIATETIERSAILFLIDKTGNIVSSRWFWAAIGLFVVLIFIYIILVVRHNNKKRRRSLNRVKRLSK